MERILYEKATHFINHVSESISELFSFSETATASKISTSSFEMASPRPFYYSANKSLERCPHAVSYLQAACKNGILNYADLEKRVDDLIAQKACDRLELQTVKNRFELLRKERFPELNGSCSIQSSGENEPMIRPSKSSQQRPKTYPEVILYSDSECKKSAD